MDDNSYSRTPEEDELLYDVRHMAEIDRRTIRSLARQFRMLNASKPMTLPDGVVSILTGRKSA